MNDLVKSMAAVVDEATVQISAIALEYRAAALVPVCSKYEIEFINGEGSWGFLMNPGAGPLERSMVTEAKEIDGATLDSARWASTPRDDLAANLHSDLDGVIACLEIQGLGSYDCLGFYVENVKREHWRVG